MRTFLPLLALLALLACTHAGRSGVMEWARGLIGARLDSQQGRIKALGDRLENLVEKVKDVGLSGGEVKELAKDLSSRIVSLEDKDCRDKEASCGRNSGQCISDLLCCDGHSDCDNGADEDDEGMCYNPVPPGKTWTGHVVWTGCVDRGEELVTAVITSNKRNAWLPSRLLLTAVISLTHRKDGKMYTESFSARGDYNFGQRRVILQPSEDAEIRKGVRIGMICDDAGFQLANCRFVNEGDLHECGRAFLGGN